MPIDPKALGKAWDIIKKYGPIVGPMLIKAFEQIGSIFKKNTPPGTAVEERLKLLESNWQALGESLSNIEEPIKKLADVQVAFVEQQQTMAQQLDQLENNWQTLSESLRNLEEPIKKLAEVQTALVRRQQTLALLLGITISVTVLLIIYEVVRFIR